MRNRPTRKKIQFHVVRFEPVSDWPRQPTAGTVLTREYRDVEYCVVATTDGQYEFNGRMYPSLSMIARAITGTRWSGPLFFGLKAPAKPNASASKGARR